MGLHKWTLYGFIYLLFLLSAKASLLKRSLDGLWSGENKNSSIQFDAQVPGGIYSDLVASGRLNNIYYRNNDRDYRWVSMEDWTYYRSFQVESDLLEKDNVMLIFHGVDTIAAIYLNNVLLGNCENMFIRYKFHIKDKLQVGKNTLKVEFQSPVVAAKERFDEQAVRYEVPPKCVPPENQGECHVNHLRKMQASFSWDWGPAFPSVGLWKSVELEAFDTFLIRDITATLIDSASNWELKLRAFMETGLNIKEISGTLEARVELQEESIVVETGNKTFLSNSEGECESELSVSIPKDKVKLWWPNGFGSQDLYQVVVSFYSDGQIGYQKEINIGFRTVELVQDPVSADPSRGRNFYFQVNNVPIFSKGSNWIPAHVLPELSYNKTIIRRLLNSAKVANMNMLRVWGGGLYESDEFYKIADELGIMIWQDLMFACSMYPTSPDFLSSVSEEVSQQVRRLQHHPSIVLWAGNNENEAALIGNWYGTVSNFSLYKEDYVLLYVTTIRPIVTKLDTTRQYAVSSPSNGLKSEEDGYIASDPYSPLYGDIHYYNYLSNGWDPSTSPRGRFISEYGFQSLPSIHTYSSVSLPSDRSVHSEFSQRRQHHPMGYMEMTMEIKMNMIYPANAEDEEGFPSYVYLSQINQAMSIKTQTENYRRNRNLDTLPGDGHTMGALYWQLNDIWQGPSWASIEFKGRWKMLHYFAKDFFAPILVSPQLVNDSEVEVFTISDLLDDIKSAVVVCFVHRWDSLTPLYNKSVDVTLFGASSRQVMTFLVENILKSSGCGEDNSAKLKCFLTFSLFDADGNKMSPDNFLFLSPLHSAYGLKRANINVTQADGPDIVDNIWKLTLSLSTDRVALFVWLEIENGTGYFSENGFLMAKPSKSIHYYSEEEISSEELLNQLSIMSLLDIY